MSIRPNYWKSIATVGRGFAWIVGIVVGIALVAGLVWKGQVGCAGDPKRAERVLEGAGYTNIEIGGANGLRCGDEGESNMFSALGPTRRRVEGVVCCSRNGCSKGCTIRMEP